jgi:hypothetical protein
MSEADVEETKMAREAPDELATARGEAARAIHEDPEGILAGLSEELPEVDRRTLERPEVRAFLIETFREAVRQGATGWIADELRQVRPWPFRLEEISGSTCTSTTEKPASRCPPTTRSIWPRGYGEAACGCTLRRGISPSTNISRRSYRRCSPLKRTAAVHTGRCPANAIQRSAWKGSAC